MYRVTLFVFLALHVWASSTAPGPGLTVYVAPDGNDGWTGTLPEPDAAGGDGPLATLAGARDRIRKNKAAEGMPEGGVVVELAPGTYRLEETFTLGAGDGGSAEAPVSYRAREKGTAIISGAAAVDAVAPVTDADILARLALEARDHVVQADLKALGISDFGSPAGGGGEGFFQGEPMTLARWPNEGFVRIKDIVVDDGHQIHGQRGSKTGKFHYDGDRPARWAAEPEGWLHGYWFWDWSDERQAIAEIDADQSWIRVAEPYHHYGYRKGQWYYAYNLLSELDAPGEWYVDRDAGILYFWPPAPVSPGDILVSVLSHLAIIEDAQHVTLHGLILRARGILPLPCAAAHSTALPPASFATAAATPSASPTARAIAFLDAISTTWAAAASWSAEAIARPLKPAAMWWKTIISAITGVGIGCTGPASP